MLFNSMVFLLYFLPVTYLVFWSLRTKQQRYIWLTLTGYVFYGAWNWKFCFLMAFSTVVSYLAGVLMERYDDDPRRRRLCLVVPIVTDLALLGFFKYTNLLVSSLGDLAHWAGIPWQAPALHIILPIGISFYTFHTISYIVDCYRRVVRPTHDFFEFSCYVSLFSQLVAGPIVRFRQIEEDLEKIGEAPRNIWENYGWSFLIIGMLQKVFLADFISAIIDPALKDYRQLSTAGTWLCMLGYTYQLYFDFAGYSNMAVGLGYLFGIRIPQNFDSPYKADSISDFWRRWHISLSSCLRDYLYIPLRGNRGGTMMVYRNLMITMLLGGLWHGANWTFLIWGGYHGLLLSLNRAYDGMWKKVPHLLRQAITFLLVLFGWVLFRANDFGMAAHLYRTMLFPTDGMLTQTVWSLIVLLCIAGLFAHTGKNTFEMEHRWNGWQTAALTAVFFLIILRIYSAGATPFLYFQF